MAQNDDTLVTDEVQAVLTKGTAKKAAAKKTASKKPDEYDGPEWPFKAGDYLYEEVVSPRGHSDEQYVAAVQQALDVKVDGVYGVVTQNAVAEHQKANDLPVTGVVDRDTWQSILG